MIISPPAWIQTELWQNLAMFVSTFVLEDVAAVGAGTLVGAGALDWASAFWACFLGIWAGDVGLYALARGLGRPWLERGWFKRHAGKVRRSEELFARHGCWILVASRILPGTRLPTYLAAGFLRMPAPRFILVMGIASFFWTAAVVWAGVQFGAILSRGLGWATVAGWAFVSVAVGCGLWVVRRGRAAC